MTNIAAGSLGEGGKIHDPRPLIPRVFHLHPLFPEAAKDHLRQNARGKSKTLVRRWQIQGDFQESSVPSLRAGGRNLPGTNGQRETDHMGESLQAMWNPEDQGQIPHPLRHDMLIMPQ